MGGEKKSFIWSMRFVIVGLAYQGKDIVFRFIIVYSKLNIGPLVIIIGLFVHEDF
jgi:hypothetical protein